MGKTIDLTGQRFGRLVVLRRVENSKHNAAQWLCRCDCGNESVANSNNLRTGHSKSCGCARRESTAGWMTRYSTKHGGAKSRLYVVWAGILSRIRNPNDNRYHCYGGRGIKICDEWMDFAVFRKWALDSGYDENAPYGECTIDRIDVDGDYEPSNCRWITLKEQAKNKRPRGI